MNSEISVADGLMMGTGEYTTGYVHGKQSGSDKKVGVVALCLFRSESEHWGAKVGELKMVRVLISYG